MNRLKYISIIFLLSSFLLSFIISCDSTNPKPPEKPPGFQEDIPWPSLADSPWPIYFGSAQGTGRTNKILEFAGTILWTIDSMDIASGAAIANDSTIYVAVNDIYSPTYKEGGLVALYPDGRMKWKFSFPVFSKGISSPLVDTEGTVYISSTHEKKFYAINPDGTLKWDLFINSRIHQSGITINKDGTIYALSKFDENYALVAISKDGNLLWKLENNRFRGDGRSGNSFSPDGKTLYVPGEPHGPAMFAIDLISQRILWEFGAARVSTGMIPLVDSDGNIYVLSEETDNRGFLYSLLPSGEIRWKYNFDESWSWVSVLSLFSMNKNGDILIGLDQLYCIDYNGTLKWKILLNKSINSPITIDGQNNAYFIIDQGDSPEILSVSSDGKILTDVALNIHSISWYSPSISEFGIVLTGFHSNLLILIK